MEMFRRFDRALARVEGRVTVLVLLSMVLVAGVSAFIRNMTRFELDWANSALQGLDWTDSYLKKGTLWLAFLGASLATHYRKHISIDLALRLVPLRTKYALLTLSTIAAGVITLFMSYAFSDAVYYNLTERPMEYEVLGEKGSIHVCDATSEMVAALQDVHKPVVFCAVRGVLSVFHIPAETPGGAFQLICPFMLVIIGLRLVCYGVGSGITFASGAAAMAAAEAEEHARLAAVHAQAGTTGLSDEERAKR